MVTILALALTLAVAIAPTGAGGHALVTPNEIPVDQPVTINFQVVADLPKPMVSIEFTAPPAFEISGIGQVPGWQSEVEGKVVTMTGSALPGTFVVVPIDGRATARAELRFKLVETADDGSQLVYDQTGFGGQAAPAVYAGLEFQESPLAEDEDGGGAGPAPVIAGVALFATLALAGVWWLRRRPDPTPVNNRRWR